mgnify:CR=1 FL=1
MDISAAVAQNTKRIREGKKLTLDAAASITGVSRSMLAQIEKGDVNPTISVLWKIANGYKVSFTSIMERHEARTTVLLKERAEPIREDEGRYINYPIFLFDEQRLFETYRIEILAGGHLDAEPHLHGAEEYITVFAGNVEIVVGQDRYSLKPGDSIRFRADIQHSYTNVGDDMVQLSMIIYYAK